MISNCPACGAPLGNSTSVCPFCNYSLSAETPKASADELYNPPIENVKPPVYEPAEPMVEPEPVRTPEPEPAPSAYEQPLPPPLADLADTGQKIRKTGGKIAIGIVIAVIVVCILCVVAIVLIGTAIYNGNFSQLMENTLCSLASLNFLLS